MTQEQINIIAIICFVGLFVGAVMYFLLGRQIASASKTNKRLQNLSGDGLGSDKKRGEAASRLNDATKRRKSVENSLSALDQHQKKKTSRSTNPQFKQLLMQAGLPMTVANFYFICACIAVVGFIVLFLIGQPLLIALMGSVALGLGLPRFVISKMRAKRFKKFVEEFPNAIDVLVRGVKSGLPINDCFRIIASEAQEPVAGEFRKIIEAQQVGVTLPQAVQRMHENVPLAETNFFAIVITIQQQAGGNLSEALSNLSAVLRDRKKMQAKIKAMSSEAVSSGFIIGALPVAVTGLLYALNKEYIMLLFTEPTGHQNLMFIAFWMSCGIFVMRKMINFDF